MQPFISKIINGKPVGLTNIDEKFNDQFFSATEGKNDIRRREIKISIGAITPTGKQILEQLKPANIDIEKQIDLLAQYLMQNFSECMIGEGAVEMSIRLLEEYKYAKSISKKLCVKNKKKKVQRTRNKKRQSIKRTNGSK